MYPVQEIKLLPVQHDASNSKVRAYDQIPLKHRFLYIHRNLTISSLAITSRGDPWEYAGGVIDNGSDLKSENRVPIESSSSYSLTRKYPWKRQWIHLFPLHLLGIKYYNVYLEILHVEPS